MWSDVRGFLENPGEVLDRLRDQRETERGDTEGLATRREDLSKHRTAEQAEKDRTSGTTAGHVSDEELETYLADLKKPDPKPPAADRASSKDEPLRVHLTYRSLTRTKPARRVVLRVIYRSPGRTRTKGTSSTAKTPPRTSCV